MGGRGRDAAHMERARAKRAPFTDPRDGRLFSQISIHRLWCTEYDRSIEALLRHRAPLGGASQLASHQRCPGCPPRGNPDRSRDYPRQTAHLEGGAGADGAAEPARSVEASQSSEPKGLIWHSYCIYTLRVLPREQR